MQQIPLSQHNQYEPFLLVEPPSARWLRHIAVSGPRPLAVGARHVDFQQVLAAGRPRQKQRRVALGQRDRLLAVEQQLRAGQPNGQPSGVRQPPVAISIGELAVPTAHLAVVLADAHMYVKLVASKEDGALVAGRNGDAAGNAQREYRPRRRRGYAEGQAPIINGQRLTRVLDRTSVRHSDILTGWAA